MSRYFRMFPTIEYDGKTVKNITRKNDFIKKTLNNPYVFLPYTVQEGEKPEDVAYLYYGSVSDTWLVLLPNQVLDPYFDWPMTDEQFHQYLASKYKDASGETNDYKIVDWTQNQQTTDNIVFYYATIEGKPATPLSENVPANVVSEVENQAASEDFDTATVTVDGVQYKLELVRE